MKNWFAQHPMIDLVFNLMAFTGTLVLGCVYAHHFYDHPASLYGGLVDAALVGVIFLAAALSALRDAVDALNRVLARALERQGASR